MGMSRAQAGKLGSLKLIENLHNRYKKNPTFCQGCETELPYKQRKNKYCSRKCSRHHSGSGRKTPNLPICKNCKAEYSSKNKQKFCSQQCHQDNLRKGRYEIIRAGGVVSAKVMRGYLIEMHGSLCLDKNCVWDFQKRPIGIELEHIDGNSENTTLENCTLLCPNCHSQTPTYKSKNNGNGRHSRRERYNCGKSF